MKTIVRPKKRLAEIKTGLVRLWFDHETSVAPDGRYKMCGGMFFPSKTVNAEGLTRIVGYALMAGRHEETKTTYIFEETEWYFVNHIESPDDGSIEYEGLVTWYNDVWNNYYCNNYAVRQDDDTQFKFVLDFSRSRMVQPKPNFIDAEWNDPIQPMSIIGRLNQLGKIKYRAAGELFKQLEAQKADKDADKHDYPAVHSLMCCLMIMDRFYT
jgi:hypothetical protein